MNPEDDHKLMDMGIGFTNIVPRTTRGIADLTKQEIADGAKVWTMDMIFQIVITFKYVSTYLVLTFSNFIFVFTIGFAAET